MMKVNVKSLGIFAILSILVAGVLLVSGCVQNQTNAPSTAIDITGPWHGTYQSSRGNGEWAWVIKKTGNGYSGILTTTGPYSGEGIPVSVNLSGNKITIGWVAAGVTFEGTVNGDRMSGTWRFQNGIDGGNWEGVRGNTSITPSEEVSSGTSGETTGETSSGTTPSTGTTSEETQGNPYDNAQETQPVGNTAVNLDSFIRPKLVTIFGGAKLVSSGTFTGSQLSVKEAAELNYVVKRKITAGDVQNLKASIESDGYTSVSSGVSSNEFTLIFMKDYQPVLLVVGDIGDQGIVVAGVIEK